MLHQLSVTEFVSAFLNLFKVGEINLAQWVQVFGGSAATLQGLFLGGRCFGCRVTGAFFSGRKKAMSELRHYFYDSDVIGQTSQYVEYCDYRLIMA